MGTRDDGIVMVCEPVPDDPEWDAQWRCFMMRLMGPIIEQMAAGDAAFEAETEEVD